ncbi:M48 family metallopeptidase [Gallaecimonas pentaromativorans]|uniref:M48 family metallopeptidase n=1 Tax=Gallaecimonas pentaromativorans TaxID=584787 RepID=UPI003A8F3564
MATVAGYLLAPRSAMRHPATLALLAGGRLQLASDIWQFEGQVADVEVSKALGNQPRNLHFAEGWSFHPIDAEPLNGWLKATLGLPWIARVERHLGWIAAGVVVAVAAVFATYRYGLPAASRLVAAQVPVVVYQQLGEQSLKLLDQALFAPSTLPKERRQQLQQQFEAMLATLSSQGISWRVKPKLVFRSFSAGPNAMALPDGTVVMTDQMVALADNDPQLLGVLYHELGHVHYHHSMNLLVQNTLMSVGVAVVIGDASSIADSLAGGAVFLVNMSYSRDAERQADGFAAQSMLKDQGTTEPLASLFEKLQKQHGGEEAGPGWISSHPDLEERIRTLHESNKKPGN